MTKDVIKSIYTKMGKSDKRNDNTEQGGWGLGAKSPLAYTNHFWIETWTKEDNEIIYRKWVQYIDHTQIGAMSLLEEESSKESITGTLITIPFELSDYDEIVYYLSKYLKYTKSKYKIEGFVLSYSMPRYNYIGSIWKLRMGASYNLNRNGSSIIIVEDIPYNIKTDIFFNYIRNNDLSYFIRSKCPHFLSKDEFITQYENFLIGLRHHTFEIEVGIGALDLSASREELQYTDRTCKEIYKTLYKMFLEFYQCLRVDLIENGSFINACKLFKESYGGVLKEEFIKYLKWKKEGLHFSSYPLIFKTSPQKEALECSLDTQSKFEGGEKIILKASKDANNLSIGSFDYLLVIQDTNYKNFSKFIKYFLRCESKDDLRNTKVIVVYPEDINKIYDWILETFTIYKLSDIVSEYKKSNTKERKKRETQKIKTHIFTGDYERPRAKGLRSYFKLDYLSIDSEQTYYYILEEELSKDIFDIYSSYELTDNLIKYIEACEIPLNNIVLSKAKIKKFEEENWIQLSSYIQQDYNNNQLKVKEYILNLFECTYIKSQCNYFLQCDLKEFKNPDSKYKEFKEFYINTLKKLNEDSKLKTLLILANSDCRTLWYYHNNSHRNFNLDNISKDLHIDCLAKVKKYKEYLKAVPLLPLIKYAGEINLRAFNKYNISIKSFIEYIEIMEERYYN